MILLFLLLIHICSALNVSSWWVGDMDNPSFQIEQLNWEAYTNIHYGGPILFKNGSVQCNKTDYNLKRLVDLAHIKNTKVMWGGGGMPLDAFLWDNKKAYMRDNYLKTIIKQIKQIESLVNEFSDFARMPKPIFIENNLVTILNDNIRLLKELDKSIIIEVKKNKKKVLFVCDNEQISRVF